MIQLVRKANSISTLPAAAADEGLRILLPQIDFMNWLSWSDERASDLILAKMTGIESGESAVAVVGCADLEENSYGEIYVSTYLLHTVGIRETDLGKLVRIEPYLAEIPRGTHIRVSHRNELAAELGLDVRGRLEETIMDWPIIAKGVPIALKFPEVGDLIVEVVVESVEPADAVAVRLGGEIGVDIDDGGLGAAAAAADAAAAGAPIVVPTLAASGGDAAVEEDPSGIYRPPSHWDSAGVGCKLASEEAVGVVVAPVAEAVELSAEERRRKVRESWLRK